MNVCQVVVHAKLMQIFDQRADNQIMGLELAAIGLGLSTFGKLLAGRSVVIHSDNTGAEVRLKNSCRGAVLLSAAKVLISQLEVRASMICMCKCFTQVIIHHDHAGSSKF